MSAEQGVIRSVELQPGEAVVVRAAAARIDIPKRFDPNYRLLADFRAYVAATADSIPLLQSEDADARDLFDAQFADRTVRLARDFHEGGFFVSEVSSSALGVLSQGRGGLSRRTLEDRAAALIGHMRSSVPAT